MSDAFERLYYAERQEAAIQAAREATCPHAKAAHLELAKLYSAEVEKNR